MTRRYLDAAGFLATIGAAVLAVASIKELLDHFDTLPEYYKAMAVLGIVAILAALLLIVFWFFQHVGETSSRLVLAAYSVAGVQWNELDDFYRLCLKVLGDRVATRERFGEWYRTRSTPHQLFRSLRRNPLRGERQVDPVG